MIANKIHFLVTIFLMFIAPISKAQKIQEITHRTISVHYNDSSVKATILLENKKVKPNRFIDYYWYYNNSIKVNQGGFEGKLLDGMYTVTNQKGGLIAKGNLKKGYRIGEWKSWNKNGDLATIYHWKKGRKNSSYQKFENKKVTEKGSYKKGLLHGKITTYQNDTVVKVQKYKDGKLIEKKPEKVKKEKKEEIETEEKEEKQPWWKFKKKNKEGKVKTDETKKAKKEKKKAEKVKKPKKQKEKKSD